MKIIDKIKCKFGKHEEFFIIGFGRDFKPLKVYYCARQCTYRTLRRVPIVFNNGSKITAHNRGLKPSAVILDDFTIIGEKD